MIIYGIKAPFPFLKGLIRHLRPVWLMEEIGAPYELRYLDIEKGEEVAPNYLAINPFGKVPSLEDGSFRLFESGAVCSYLADKYKRFIPTPGTPERAIHDQWLITAVTMFEPHTLGIAIADFFYKNDAGGPVLREASLEFLTENLAVLENHLGKTPYLTGKIFQVADLMMTSCLNIVSHTDILKQYPQVFEYYQQNTARPAHGRAAVQQ